MIALTLLLAASIAADVPSWPQFRGPQGTGIAAPGVKPPIEFGPGKRMLWKTEIPAGHSSPVAWGNRIFLSTFDTQAKKLEILALDRSSGKILWRRAIPAKEIEEVHEISSPASATPAVDRDRVYAYFGSYGLIAFDHDGKELWELPLPLVKLPYGSGTSPILAGDLLVLDRDEGDEPYLLAVNRQTGKVVWKQPQYAELQGRPFNSSTPALWKDEIVLHHRNEIVGFDLATGARKWWVKTNTQGADSPVAGPDAIYVGTWFNQGEPDLRVPYPDFETMIKLFDKNHDGVLTADEFPPSFLTARRPGLEGIRGADQSIPGARVFRAADANHDGKVDRAEWEAFIIGNAEPSSEHGIFAIIPGGHGDVGATNIGWKEPRGVPEIPMPLWFNYRVYAVANGGTVSCMDAKTGKVVFRGRLAPGAYFSSPVEAGGKIYFASHEGVVSVISGGEVLEVLAKNDLGEPLFATPAFVENVIYVRTPTKMYAFSN
jgi:outer membrane protein assembly factor BamB